MRKKMAEVSTCDVPAFVATKEESLTFSWVKRVGSFVQHKDFLGTCKTPSDTFRITAATAGTLRELPDSKEGNWKGMIEGCKHPMAVGRMCADCGESLTANGYVRLTAVSEKVTYRHEHAKAAETAYKQRLFKSKKLVVVLDIDHTLVHTCDANDPVAAGHTGTHHITDICGYSYAVQLRPCLKEFME